MVDSQLFDRFFDNPVFFLEISRVKSGLSKAALPQQILPELAAWESRADKLVLSFSRGEMELDELLSSVKNVERGAYREVWRSEIGRLCREANLTTSVKVHVLGRVFSKPALAPEISVYIHDPDVDVESEIERMSSTEIKVLKGIISFEKGRDRIVRMEGKMLGYPRCCIESYVVSKRDGILSAERRIVLECVEKGIFSRVLSSLKKSKTVCIPSLFTSGFFPCSVECDSAEEIGNELLNWLSGFNLGVLTEAFRFRTMVNCLYLLTTGFTSKLREVDAIIDDETRELLISTSRVISNITEFTNNLIVKIFGERITDERKQKD